MKAIIRRLPGPGADVIDYVKDAKIPVPADDEVLIKVKATAICGSDVGFWKWSSEAQGFYDTYGSKEPFVWGHEFSGVVESVGSKVTNIKVGDHVAVDTHIYCGQCHQCKTGDAHVCSNLSLYGLSRDGSFAEYTTAPAKICYVVPKEISFDVGSLLEPGCCAMFGIDEANFHEGDVAMIYGCGPIGQMAIMIMRAMGAKAVLAVDINDERCALARELGAIPINSMKEDIADYVKKYASERNGVDAILEISGAPVVYKTLFDHLRPGGRVSILTHPAEPVSLNMKKIQHKSAKITGIYGRRIWDSWDHLIKLIVDGKVDLSKIIAHRFPLSRTCEAIDMMSKGAGQIVLYPEMED